MQYVKIGDPSISNWPEVNYQTSRRDTLCWLLSNNLLLVKTVSALEITATQHETSEYVCLLSRGSPEWTSWISSCVPPQVSSSCVSWSRGYPTALLSSETLRKVQILLRLVDIKEELMVQVCWRSQPRFENLSEPIEKIFEGVSIFF